MFISMSNAKVFILKIGPGYTDDKEYKVIVEMLVQLTSSMAELIISLRPSDAYMRR